MRVAYVASDIPEYSLEFAEMMSSRCDVLLCTPDKFYAGERHSTNIKLDIDWLSWPRQRDFRSVAFTYNLATRIRCWNPDIVHFLNERNVWHWILAYLIRHTRKVTTIHDVVPHPGDTSSRRIPRIFINALVRTSDAIIVHGDKLQAEAIRTFPFDPLKVFSIPLVPSIYPSVPPKYEKPKDGIFRLLFYGRIYEYKGLRYLLEAMPFIHAKLPNVRLVVAGEGENISHLKQHVAGLSCVEFRNMYLTPSESAQLFTESDLLVLPYIEASQSGPLMTAMAFGLPVVSTDVGELSSVTESAGLGLVVPPRDPKALALAVINIALNEDFRKQLSTNCISAINGKYSRSSISTRVLHIYQELLKP